MRLSASTVLGAAALYHGVFLLLPTTAIAEVITIPLVPHHVQQQRRRLSGVVQPVQEIDNIDEYHPRHHHRSLVAQQVGALYQGYGTHYVDLWCGTPPQRQTLIVDTGSGMTAFPCSGCRDCGSPKFHIDALFQESASSTFERAVCNAETSCATERGRCDGNTQTCNIKMSYAEGSRWDAYEAVDRCYVGGPHERPLSDEVHAPGDTFDDIDPTFAVEFGFDLTFGCQTLVTGLFQTQLADGIMGMDMKHGTFWQQMFQAGRMGQEQKFALCFSRQPTAERKGTEAGALTLGGTDVRLHQSPQVYTTGADQGRPGFFSIHVRRIFLRDSTGGEFAQSNHEDPTQGVTEVNVDESVINTGGVIVDSGTTDTYWNKKIASAFQQVFGELSGGVHHDNQAKALTEEEMMALPTILFQLQTDQNANPHMDPLHTPGMAGMLDPDHPTDILIAFPPSHYMEYDDKSKTYTSRFYVTEGRGSVFGANAMMGHDVHFDVDLKRIGWAKSSCDYTKLVKDNGYDFDITGKLPPLPAPVPVPPPTRPPVAAPKPPPPTPEPFVPPTLPPVSIVDDDVVTSTNNDDQTEEGVWDTMKKEGTALGEDIKLGLDTFLEICSGPECRYPVGIILILALCCGACMVYCCCCCCCNRRRRASSRRKYREAEVVEMTTYQDDPEDDVDGFEDEPLPSNGSNGSYSDSPSKRNGNGRSAPEFQGDFM